MWKEIWKRLDAIIRIAWKGGEAYVKYKYGIDVEQILKEDTAAHENTP